MPDTKTHAAATTRLHEIRLVGRGGQGVVTAGDLLGAAAVREGRWAQSIPTFGPERRGALSQCTLRISESEILLKCSSTTPSVLLLLDPTIWHFANVLLGLRPGGTLVFNSSRPPGEIRADLDAGTHGYRAPTDDYTVFAVDATEIAISVLGRPITNTAMMGAMVGATGILTMDSVAEVLGQRFGEKGEANVMAVARLAAEKLVRDGG